MKVKIKDLEPNPFREWENFQLNKGIVEMLKNSIQETFFWENMIGRKNNGKLEIAYGHHRLKALRELYPDGEKEFNIPIYPLNDEQMFIIMARENETGKNLTIPNIDLTIKKAKEFLENNPEIAKKYAQKIDEGIGIRTLMKFLGWSFDRIRYSLDRVKCVTETRLIDKEAVESMPTEKAAQRFVSAIKKTGLKDKEAQKRVAERIIEEEDFSEEGIRYEALEEKIRPGEERKEKEKEFTTFIEECSKLINILNKKLDVLIDFKSDFDSTYYKNTFARFEFDGLINMLQIKLKKLMEDKS